MKKIFLLLTTVTTLLSLTFAWSAPVAFADAKTDVCKGVSLTGGDCKDTGNGPSVQSTITSVINLLSLVIGIIAVIMIIIGGAKYIMSGGEAANTKSAKDTILNAIIGLVIVLLAQVIVRFVLEHCSCS